MDVGKGLLWPPIGRQLNGDAMGITQCVKRANQHNHHGRASIFGSRTRRWGEFAARVARLAGGLRFLGVESGDRIAILSLNSDHYLEIYVAVPWAGAVVVPLNIRWSPRENIYALNDSGAKVLLVDDTFGKQAASIRVETPSVRVIIHMGDAAAPAGMTSYEHLIEGSVPISANIGRRREACLGGRDHGLEARIVAEGIEIGIGLCVVK